MKISTKRLALSAAALLIGLSAGLPALAQGYPPGVVVRIAPPALRAEPVPPPPPYPAVWQPGFWRWDGARYVWARGHYGRPPRGRHEWVPGHWDPRPTGHVWVEGSWR